MSAPQNSGIAARIAGLSPKAKQYVVLGALGTAFMGLVFGGVALWKQKPPMMSHDANKRLVPTNIATPGAQADARDLWMSQSSQQLKEMDSVIQGLKQKIEDAGSNSGASGAQAAEQSAISLPKLPPLPEFSPQQNTPLMPPPVPQVQEADPVPDAAHPPRIPGIAVFEIGGAPDKAEAPANQAGAKTYIPSGSFMRVALLGGMDAPTGGQAQNNPWPVLMRVQDNAFLPNNFRSRVKECFMLGSGYGDISSERAYLRLESLSCVLENGEVVDTSAKGYVVGEDGKAGMRGRLVSKQGQVLANALMTGVISGIGQGFQQSATTYSTSALGSVGTIADGKHMEAGIGAGVGKALDRLSQYYITLAEKMFPIIEVDAGRVVDVVLTKGVTLGVGDNMADGDYTNIWKRGRAMLGRSLEP
jgi:conjugal transfer pilus assembly protein TraB